MKRCALIVGLAFFNCFVLCQDRQKVMNFRAALTGKTISTSKKTPLELEQEKLIKIQKLLKQKKNSLRKLTKSIEDLAADEDAAKDGIAFLEQQEQQNKLLDLEHQKLAIQARNLEAIKELDAAMAALGKKQADASSAAIAMLPDAREHNEKSTTPDTTPQTPAAPQKIVQQEALLLTKPQAAASSWWPF